MIQKGKKKPVKGFNIKKISSNYVSGTKSISDFPVSVESEIHTTNPLKIVIKLSINVHRMVSDQDSIEEYHYIKMSPVSEIRLTMFTLLTVYFLK